MNADKSKKKEKIAKIPQGRKKEKGVRCCANK
jgi:hypothetical protein